MRNGDPRPDTLAFALRPDGPGWPNPPWATEPLRALMRNPVFAVDFINRYADYLNTMLRPEVTRAVLDQAVAAVAPEMPRHLERWGRVEAPGGPRMQPGAWEAEIAAIGDWLQARPRFAREHIVNNFRLDGTYQLDLRVEPPGSGTLQLTGVTVEAPFTGTYFAGVPITITAVPAEGRQWRGWDPGAVPQEQTVVLTPRANTTLTARFE
jgi:hypothetical protein